MRENGLKRKLGAGQVAIGTTLAFPCSELVEACGHLGFDFVFIDGEHDPAGPRDCQELIREGLTKAKRAGIYVGAAARDAASARACVERGFNTILASSATIFVEGVHRFMRESGRAESRTPAVGGAA